MRTAGWIIGCASLSLVTLFASGCPWEDDPADPDDRRSCTVNGTTYAHGATGIPAPDGCNTCDCYDGSLGCTEMACPDGKSCVLDGVVYPHGATNIPAPDGCNTCGCHDGSLGCTEIGCPDGDSCELDGEVYPHGTTGIPAPDGCNTCDCFDGALGCTEIGCPGGEGCEVDGQWYPDGATGIPAPDGCNTCVCEDGLLGCTERACPPALTPIQLCGPDGASDPFEVSALALEGDRLDITVSYGGGCEEHDFVLCYGPAFLESDPVQVNLELRHDAHNDPCEAYLTETLSFDLAPLRQAYHEAYGDQGSASMQLNFEDGLLYTF